MLPDVYVNQMTAYHPPTVLGNDFFEAILPTNDQWITTRTGIKTRPVMMNYSGHFPVTEIAKRACMKLFQTNGQKQDVDLLVFGGAIDELPYPSAGSLLSAELGLEIPTYHHKNACASGIFGLALAKAFLQTGMAHTALVVNSEPTSYHNDYSSRENCILWGDGATAAIVSTKPTGLKIGPIELTGWGDQLINAGPRPGSSPAVTLDDVRDKIPGLPEILKKLPKNRQGFGSFRQDGLKVYEKMIDLIPKLALEYLAKYGMTLDDIDYFVTHQANLMMQNEICRRLGIPESKHLHNVEKYGNRSSVGCMSVLAESVEGSLDGLEGKLQPGQKVMISAFGAGISIGTCVFEMQP